MSGSLLAAFHDPGAFMMARPVLRRIASDLPSAMELQLSDVVAGLGREAGLVFSSLPSTLTPGQARERLKGARALVTGTSWGSDAEQRLRNEAADLGIPSLAFVDYWASYVERWANASYALTDLWDEVCVVDEPMQAEMASHGFPARKLHVTGHPHWEEIASRAAPPRASRAAGAPIRVLFLSEPFRIEGEDPRPRRLAALHAALEALAAKRDCRFEVLWRAHPKEGGRGSLPAGSAGVQWRDGSVDAEKAAETDVVLGYHTMGLLERALAGEESFALPFLPLSEGLASAFRRNGVQVLGAEAAEIARAMEPALFSGGHRERVPGPVGATDRVLRIVRRMTDGKSASAALS